jgi:ferritin-like metal-binding protein YciE
MTTLHRPAGDLDERGVTLDAPLRALQVAIAAYGAAISTATRLGHASIADLLAESLREKDDMVLALAGQQTVLAESVPGHHLIQR